MNILKFLEGLRTESLNRIFEYITMFGEEILMVLIIAILWFAIDKKFAQKMFFITVASLSINSIIKNFTKIPRPFATGELTCVRPETATGYSFPSGHTQNFSTWSTVVGLKIRKLWFWLIIAILIPLVAFSRLYLGAHYPSDVIVGAMLGIIFAFIGNIIFEKVSNTRVLYSGMAIILTPFIIFFMLYPDPLFEDLYKFYGMIIGLYLAICFEEKYAPIDYNVPAWKRTVRVIGGILIAFCINELIIVPHDIKLWLIFLIEIIKHLLLVFVLLGVYPFIFKKCNI